MLATAAVVAAVPCVATAEGALDRVPLGSCQMISALFRSEKKSRYAGELALGDRQTTRCHPLLVTALMEAT
jgi:hypothetical protein